MYIKNQNLTFLESGVSFDLYYDHNLSTFTLKTSELITDEEKSTEQHEILKHGDITEVHLDLDELKVLIDGLIDLIPRVE